ncbi:MAG: hypothetical protein K1Y02_05505 [Candidatus Hydrogenedentes bacterium]|nr:hypothetical protein [Candidatus Hydrogenedentota bacterium]
MLRVFAIGFVFCAAVVCAESPFPAELEYLNQFASSEDAMVTGVRQYHVLQQAMADWDVDIAESLAGQGEKEDASDRMKQRQQRFELIEKAYNVLLGHYPHNARAQNYYGEFLYDCKGDQMGAIKAWKIAIAEDSKLSLPYNNLGIHYCHRGDIALGLEYQRKAVDLDPDNPDYKYNLAQTYLINWPEVQKELKWDKKKVFFEAMKLSRRAAELKPDDYELLEDYAVNFFAADRFEVEPNWNDAAKAWEQARAKARRTDQVFYTWLNEARVRIRQPEYEQAMICLDEALKLEPTSDVAKKLKREVEAKLAQ